MAPVPLNDPSVSRTLADVVPLGKGPPTREELVAHYPAKFTWRELRTFINSGDLGLLKRDKKLQLRCALVAVRWSCSLSRPEVQVLQLGSRDQVGIRLDGCVGPCCVLPVLRQ